MVVVSIAGILTTLAIPSFQSMARHYRAVEASRAALSAVTAARALAQRRNTPVTLRIEAQRVILRVPEFNEAPDTIRKNVLRFVDDRVIALPRDVSIVRLDLVDDANAVSTRIAGAADADLVFCAASGTYFRDAVSGRPLCPVGNLTSSSARIALTTVDGPFHIVVNAALGTVELKGGAP
jgi:type II secretory pathway pseudopilin PulG